MADPQDQPDEGPVTPQSAGSGPENKPPPKAAKKAPAKKAPAKKAAARKTPAKKATAKKTPAKKAAPAKPPVTGAPARRPAAKDTAEKPPVDAAAHPAASPLDNGAGRSTEGAKEAAAQAKSTVEHAGDSAAAPLPQEVRADRLRISFAVAIAVSILAILLIRQLRRSSAEE